MDALPLPTDHTVLNPGLAIGSPLFVAIRATGNRCQHYVLQRMVSNCVTCLRVAMEIFKQSSLLAAKRIDAMLPAGLCYRFQILTFVNATVI